MNLQVPAATGVGLRVGVLASASDDVTCCTEPGTHGCILRTQPYHALYEMRVAGMLEGSHVCVGFL